MNEAFDLGGFFQSGVDGAITKEAFVFDMLADGSDHVRIDGLAVSLGMNDFTWGHEFGNQDEEAGEILKTITIL